MGMNVQELIDELSKVEDKSKMVQVYSDSVYEDADTISEYDDTIVIFLIMERKIGEIFELGDEWYQCIIGHCNQCSFNEAGICKFIGNPYCANRKDKQNVIFKKLEKVGEPFTSVGKLYQHYKVFDIDNVYGDVFWCVHNYKAKTLTIEIKQNKEDMEEKGQCCDNRFEIIAKAKEALLKETNIARDEQEMAVIDNILFRCWQMGWLDKYDDTKDSNSESIGKNLKPFSLEAAKAGKPVCTRDGRKARIICFDLQSIEKTPTVAAVQVTDKQEVISHYYEDGRQFVDGISELDLMMLPEKKEGWVNVYKGGLLDTKSYPTKKEAFDKACPEGYVDTIKINWSE